jgi:hypothetical protein
MMLSEGQMNDQKAANMLAPLLPAARELICDRGYDSYSFRVALAEGGIAACIPSTKEPETGHPARQGALRPTLSYRERLRPHQGLATHRNTIRPMPNLFLGAITLAAIVIFWISE